jgi:hypothetical protein
MLAALLVMVLGAAFALVVVAAVASTFEVGVADAEAWRADGARAEAVEAALAEARWRPADLTGTVAGAEESRSETWSAEWAPCAAAATSWPCRRVDVTATSGAARRSDRLTVHVQAEDWATGVTCAGDAEFRAPFTVAGSGVYAGGCVRGREHVMFAGDGATEPDQPDYAHGEDFAVAAVHAAAGIFAGDMEIHDTATPVGYPDDGDQHTGEVGPAEWVAGPSAEFLLAAEAEAEAPGAALADGTLRLDALEAPGTGALSGGRCLLLPRGDTITIVGVAPAAAGRLLVVCPGDAVLGQPGEPVELQGGLVVCGRLDVRGDLRLWGSLHAGSLVSEAQAVVTLGRDWQAQPLPGAARPVVVEQGAW